VVFRVPHDPVLPWRLRMHGNLLRAVMHLDIAAALAHPDLFTRISPRHGVPAALPRHKRIPGHLAQLLIEVGIRRPSVERFEAHLIGIPACHDLLVRGPMHALVGHCPDPLP
jgi:hypothetical protein